MRLIHHIKKSPYYLLSPLLLLCAFGCNEEKAEVAPMNVPLILISNEPAGDHCEGGGVKIESGLDANGNELLDSEEIQTTSFICDGISDNVLVVTSDEPAGENCQDGGLRLLIGIDENNNEELDADEIAQITFICDGQSASSLGKSYLVLSGSITDEEAQDRINSTAGPHTQFVIIKNTTRLKEVNLSSLESLSGIEILDNDSLQSVDFSRLQLVEDGITIGNNLDTLSLDFASLVTVNGDIELYQNRKVNYNFESLSKLTNLIVSDQRFQEIAFPALQDLRSFQITRCNFGVITCDFPELSDLDWFSITNNNADSINVHAPGLTHVENVEYINNLTDGISKYSPDFENLEEIGHLLIIANNSLPDSLVFPNLKNISTVDIQRNVAFASKKISFPRLVKAYSFRISGNGISHLSFPILEESETFLVDQNTVLNELDISMLREVGTISINNNAWLGTLDINSLKFVENNFTFANNRVITSFSLPSLDSAGSIIFFENTALEIISFENLEKVGQLQFNRNDALTEIHVPALTAINEQLSIYENPLLNTVNLDPIESIGGESIYLNLNAFDSDGVNYLLGKLANLNPALTDVTIELAQSTPAPPTGQGIIDKATMEESGNTVNTD